jgi:hypothetical protein
MYTVHDLILALQTSYFWRFLATSEELVLSKQDNVFVLEIIVSVIFVMMFTIHCDTCSKHVQTKLSLCVTFPK